ncbi:DUF6088 family protein [Burkholderia cenocepacia]|uniref:site-specific DNA-methyltransferase (cytosine-N(4)-specific) n=1 Tax=Burkholderia cenocepacia TaxID=95486 RepID=A0ABD4UQ19_9BURK|nr:DUF6088 family protein [Burkholderia cenocepacia]MCW3699585.1 DUF6088 family protein [Burkholderia cenocepacia]MCW3707214.1 DUF6088 family protein [Burkholderia cenocepacia]MCW3716475.1 DUF6088 family protein [Burkholderia cenocepacia]MCW3723487.1 DUF6088 family protein [Burkholderia cenocepacia]MCW3729539.1 DUF6088 family protein [Burkholderia cenocepacia]
MNTIAEIRSWLLQIDSGRAFCTEDVRSFGSRAAVDQALCRLVRHGDVIRLARGIFIRSEGHTGKSEQDLVDAAVSALSKSRGVPVQVNGETALRSLGVASPTPGMKPRTEFLWVAGVRRFSVAGKQILVRNVSPRKVALCNQPAGLAITGIWDIGKHHMTRTIMKNIMDRLPDSERERLKTSISTLPGWAAELLPMGEEGATRATATPAADDTHAIMQNRSIRPSPGKQVNPDNLKRQWLPSTVEGRWCGFGPYYAMFPVEFARKIIARHCPIGGTVLDPFCGRGTVPFVALATGRHGAGCDINPVAWIYAKVKTDPHPVPDDVIRRAEEIKASIIPVDRIADNEFQELAWSTDVLAFLNAARRLLDWRDSNIDRTLMGTLLIHLHAKLGDGFSNQLRQSKSMSPEYSVRWWRTRNMLPPNVDAVELIRKKVAWRYAKGCLATAPNMQRPDVLLGDSRHVLRTLGRDFKANLILTSPPYYGVTNYRYDNWIRLWLLGEGPSLPEFDHKGRHHNQKDYHDLLNQTFQECSMKSAPTSVIYVRTDARNFTLQTTIDTLRSAWRDKNLYFRHEGFQKATQTALFGDKGEKPGEIDLIMLPKGRRPPEGMIRLRDNETLEVYEHQED